MLRARIELATFPLPRGCTTTMLTEQTSMYLFGDIPLNVVWQPRPSLRPGVVHDPELLAIG
jgi:hypothetical protein